MDNPNNLSNILTTHSNLKDLIDNYTDKVSRISHDSSTILAARNLIPVEHLISENNLEIDTNLDKPENRETLLPHLVRWFKNDFFRWFNPPSCEHCASRPAFVYKEYYFNAEGIKVERFVCPHNCKESEHFDFLRHNDPAILLHTRQGRCGEWAACMFVLLKSVKFETRLCIDISDHVWNEIYSETQNRWIHVDPCENLIDGPLIYELGWGKKLTYVIAFSDVEVQDVTWRYIVDQKQTERRRKEYEEDWLSKYILFKSTPSLQSSSNPERYIMRRFREILSFVRPPNKLLETDIDNQWRPRQSGPLEWRIARGEHPDQ